MECLPSLAIKKLGSVEGSTIDRDVYAQLDRTTSYRKTAEMTQNNFFSEDRSVPSTFQETAMMSKPDQNDSILESL